MRLMRVSFSSRREALLDLPPQGQPVSVDLLHAKRDEVIDVALHLFDVADEEEHLQELECRTASRLALSLA